MSPGVYKYGIGVKRYKPVTKYNQLMPRCPEMANNNIGGVSLSMNPLFKFFYQYDQPVVKYTAFVQWALDSTKERIHRYLPKT